MFEGKENFKNDCKPSITAVCLIFSLAKRVNDPDQFIMQKLSSKDGKMRIWLFFFLTSIHSLSALSFFDLKEAIPDTIIEKERFYSPLQNLHGQEITIKGFVYHKEGQWILSAEPNLKSCCIGTSQNLLKQIYLDHYESDGNSQHLVTLQGNFVINPQWNNKELESFYFLTHTKVIPSSNRAFFYAILSGGILISLGMLMILIKRSQQELYADPNSSL